MHWHIGCLTLRNEAHSRLSSRNVFETICLIGRRLTLTDNITLHRSRVAALRHPFTVLRTSRFKLMVTGGHSLNVCQASISFLCLMISCSVAESFHFAFSTEIMEMIY